jgi:hypothetical protein
VRHAIDDGPFGVVHKDPDKLHGTAPVTVWNALNPARQ